MSSDSSNANPVNRKPYVQKQSANWWLQNRYYRFYMLREATSVPIFGYALLLIWGLLRLSQGEAAFTDWLALMQHPLMMLFHLLVIAAALLHAYTWFDLTPKILVIRLGDFRVPDRWVKLGHYGGFVVTSAALLCLALLFIKGGA
ncbi:MAG: hypothetical protein V7752_13230 [Halopseudomonas sp.]